MKNHFLDSCFLETYKKEKPVEIGKYAVHVLFLLPCLKFTITPHLYYLILAKLPKKDINVKETGKILAK